MCELRDRVLGNTAVGIIPIAAVTMYVCMSRVWRAMCAAGRKQLVVCRTPNCHSFVVDLLPAEISRGLAADFMYGGVSVGRVRPALGNCVASSLVTTWRIILFSPLLVLPSCSRRCTVVLHGDDPLGRNQRRS